MVGRWDRLKELNRRLSALGALLEDETIPSMPEWVQFQTTYVCNLECPHCSTHGTEERRREYNYERKGMDRELLSDVAAKSLPVADEVTLSVSGEPLATPGLEKLLDEFEPYGAKLNLVTNGTTLSPQRLSYLIPIAGHIKISLDGATPRVLETTRKGARWAQVLQKVRLLMRTIELLPEGYERPRVQISAVAMASNLRELPWLIRLAKVLGIKTVGVAPIIVHFDHLADELLDKHQAFYNACREEAIALAEELKVHLFLPPAFPDVPPDPTAIPRGGKLMIPDLPDAYYETVPPLESAFDAEAIDEQARRTVQMITDRLSSDDARGAAAVDQAIEFEAIAEAKLESVLTENRDRLASMREEPEEVAKVLRLPPPPRLCQRDRRRDALLHPRAADAWRDRQGRRPGADLERQGLHGVPPTLLLGRPGRLLQGMLVRPRHSTPSIAGSRPRFSGCRRGLTAC